jgi:hypothetical protein
MAQTLGTAYLGGEPGAVTTTFTAKGTWDATATPGRRGLLPYKAASSIGTTSKSENTATTPWKVLTNIFVGPALAADAGYTGTIDLILAVVEANADADFYTALHVWVAVGETNVVRSTLLSNYAENTTNEWPTTATGIALQSAQALSGAWSEGDHIIVEFGYISRNSHTTSRAGTTNIGSNSATGDLTVGSTNTALNPTITFNPALTMAAPDNDLVGSATVIGSLPYTVSNVKQSYATGESGSGGPQRDPFISGSSFAAERTLWWYYEPDAPETLTIHVDGSDGNLYVAVFEEDAATLVTSAADGQDIGYALNPSSGTPLVVNITAPVYILIGYDAITPGTPGLTDLSITGSGGTGAPDNNTCADAEDIASLPHSETVDTTGDDSTDAGDPAVSALGAGTPHNTIFYTFTPGSTTYYRARVEDAGGETFVAVYTGICGSLVEVESNTGDSPAAVWIGTMGTEYTIMFGSVDAGGGDLAVVVETLPAEETEDIIPSKEFSFGGHGRNSGNYGIVGASDFNYLIGIFNNASAEPSISQNGNVFAMVSFIAGDQSIGDFTNFIWIEDTYNVRLQWPGASGLQTETVEVPYTPVYIGEPADGVQPTRSTWGFQAWAVAVRTSSFDPNVGTFAADGYIALQYNDEVLIEHNNIVLGRGLSDDSMLKLGVSPRVDLDSVWIAKGIDLPSTGEYGIQGRPTNRSLLFFDPFDAVNIGWVTWNFFTSDRPYSNPNAGRDGAGDYALSQFMDDPAVAAPLAPTEEFPSRALSGLYRSDIEFTDCADVHTVAYSVTSGLLLEFLVDGTAGACAFQIALDVREYFVLTGSYSSPTRFNTGTYSGPSGPYTWTANVTMPASTEAIAVYEVTPVLIPVDCSECPEETEGEPIEVTLASYDTSISTIRWLRRAPHTRVQ